MGRQTTLKVTAKGQITLKGDVLAHLGVHPGDKIAVDLCPQGVVVMKAAPSGTIESFFGSLPDKGHLWIGAKRAFAWPFGGGVRTWKLQPPPLGRTDYR